MNDIIIEGHPGHTLADTELASRALKILTDSYPGYIWEIGLDEEDLGGIMTVVNKTVNEYIFDQNYGYVLKLSRVYTDPTLNCVKHAGGEILERANLARGRNNGNPVKNIDGVDHNRHPLIPEGFYGH